MTDGRFSGGSVGLVIGHVGPEAAIGGPIALIEDGDEIIVDLTKNEINCTQLLDTNTFESRQNIWQTYPPQRWVAYMPTCLLQSVG